MQTIHCFTVVAVVLDMIKRWQFKLSGLFSIVKFKNK